MTEGQQTPPAARPMSRRNLVFATAGSLVAAGLIVLGAILPAEFDVDPLGLGKLTGTIRLWAPGEKKIDPKQGALKRARESDVPLRSDVIEIPLNDPRTGFELEYKVHMKKDATLVYEWEVIGSGGKPSTYYDFHGHTTPRPGEQMTVATYKQGSSVSQKGALTAPFDGIQGWFFQPATDKPVIVRVKLHGFYDLVPPGEAGNEKGILANAPAAQAVVPR